jgi:hypothetical protein
MVVGQDLHPADVDFLRDAAGSLTAQRAARGQGEKQNSCEQRQQTPAIQSALEILKQYGIGKMASRQLIHGVQPPFVRGSREVRTVILQISPLSTAKKRALLKRK